MKNVMKKMGFFFASVSIVAAFVVSIGSASANPIGNAHKNHAQTKTWETMFDKK